MNGSKYIGGIAGEKSGYGTHYIENCYWPKGFNVDACSSISGTGDVEVTNSTAYEKSYMQSQAFVNELNAYVTTYNEEHKTDSDFIELLTWELDKETGYPTLNLE